MSVTYKVEFDGDIRRFQMPLPVAFASLEDKLRELFLWPAGQRLRVRYADVGGELVTATSEADLCEALACSTASPAVIRLYAEPVATLASCSERRGRLEKKQQMMLRLRATRERLDKRQHALAEQSRTVDAKLDGVAQRISNVNRRMARLAVRFPELASLAPADAAFDRSQASIYCDGCDVGIVHGAEVHYHCTACGNFDLCQRCADDVGHHHPLLRIEAGTRIVAAAPAHCTLFDAIDADLATFEASCTELWRELRASGLLCTRNLVVLSFVTVLSFVLAVISTYAISSALFSVITRH